VFKIIGEKDKIELATNNFVEDLNKYMENVDTDDYSDDESSMLSDEWVRKKVNSIIPISKMRFAVKEHDDGYEIVAPFLTSISNKKLVGIIFKKIMFKAKRSLKNYMERVKYCSNCHSVTEQDFCEKCKNQKLEEIEYEIK